VESWHGYVEPLRYYQRSLAEEPSEGTQNFTNNSGSSSLSAIKFIFKGLSHSQVEMLIVFDKGTSVEETNMEIIPIEIQFYIAIAIVTLRVISSPWLTKTKREI